MAGEPKRGSTTGGRSDKPAGRHAPMTNTRMFLTMLFGAIFRRRGRASMAVVASMVGAATLFCLAAVCLEVPRQMNQEMRAYGANLVVTPIQQPGQSRQGIDPAMVSHTTEMVTAKASAKHATYRYESVRVNAGSHMMAGIDADQVHQLNHHWNVDGQWPKDGSVMVGRDLADSLGLKPGRRITISYRASDNAEGATGTEGVSGAGRTGGGQSTQEGSTGRSNHVHGSATMSDDAGRPGQLHHAGNPSGQSGSQTQPVVLTARPAQADASSPAGPTMGSAPVDGSIAQDAQEKGMELRVGGIVDTGGSEDQIIYSSMHDIEALTGFKRGSDVIEYSVNTMGPNLTAIARSINDMTSMGVKAQTVTRITSGDTHTIAMLQTLFWLVSIVVLVLTFVGVGTTMASIVSQRRSEIGLRKALGATSGSIGAEFYAESAFYGLLGGLIGTVLGYIFARLLCTSVFQRSLGFNWWLALASVLLSTIISVVASIRPVRRASRIDPALVLREE